MRYPVISNQVRKKSKSAKSYSAFFRTWSVCIVEKIVETVDNKL